MTYTAASAHNHGTATSSPTWNPESPAMSPTMLGSQKVTA